MSLIRRLSADRISHFSLWHHSTSLSRSLSLCNFQYYWTSRALSQHLTKSILLLNSSDSIEKRSQVSSVFIRCFRLWFRLFPITNQTFFKSQWTSREGAWNQNVRNKLLLLDHSSRAGQVCICYRCTIKKSFIRPSKSIWTFQCITESRFN